METENSYNELLLQMTNTSDSILVPAIESFLRKEDVDNLLLGYRYAERRSPYPHEYPVLLVTAYKKIGTMYTSYFGEDYTRTSCNLNIKVFRLDTERILKILEDYYGR